MKIIDPSQFAADYTAGDSTTTIGLRYGVCAETVRTHLHKSGVPVRWRTHVKKFNRVYFDTLDTWGKFYILGFFAADGNIHESGPTAKGLMFTCKDRDVLDFISNEVGLVDPTIYTRSTGVGNMVLSDTHMAEVVEGYGFHPRKAKTLLYPDVVRGHPYEDAFITGLFDGDGSLVKYTSGFWSLRFYGTQSIVGGVAAYFAAHGIHIDTRHHAQEHLWVARTGSREVITACMTTINYLTSPFAMNRKRLRYQDFLSSSSSKAILK